MLTIIHNFVSTEFYYAFFVPHFVQNPHQPKDYSMTLIYALFASTVVYIMHHQSTPPTSF